MAGSVGARAPAGGAGSPSGAEKRVFVRDGLRSYRRTYRVSEVYWGGGIGAALLGIVGWVGYKGAHPDPSLFDMSAALQGQAAGAVPSAERGALPADLAHGEFREGKIGAFTPDTLYIKINGRAEFYAAFGVKSLHTITLEGGGPTGASVEIELFDLGESRNALGAYQGERAPGLASTHEAGSTFHFDRNAAFLARGAYYVRFVGSDESPAVLAEVRRLLELFQSRLPAEELPWGISFFVDQMKLSPSQVSYLRENAFSFGFARDVFKASLSPADSREDMEAFVSVQADADAAQRLALAYQEGFRGLGVPAGEAGPGIPLFKDEFLGSLSTATSVERWVIGVRGAPQREALTQTLERLKAGLAALPAAVKERAQPSAEPAESEPAAAAAPAAAPPAAEPTSVEGDGDEQ